MPAASLESRSLNPSPTPFVGKNKNRPSGGFEEFTKDEIKEAKKKAPMQWTGGPPAHL